ncbi:MAG: 23S rRNA (guanosine(2251)-2'-O)-methyltransferase RlmB [Steroidobacteraceae bacterium]
MRHSPRGVPAGTELIYGMHAVRAILTRHPDSVLCVKIARGRDDPRARDLEALARRQARPVERVDAQALDRAAGEVVHQGVAAEIAPLPAWSEDDLLAALTGLGAVPAPPAPPAPPVAAPLILALDGVQDPHNLGACLRTADACGALAVLVPRDRAAQLTPAARKVAAGAAESTPVVACTNLARMLALLRQSGLWVFGADADAGQDACAVDLTGAAVLVLGAEGRGLRQLTREHCDFLVRLPRLGAVESLNVSVAAGMLLYEAVRQRTAGSTRPVGSAG